MNKCKICNELTKNKHYCSMKCRDISRKTKAYVEKKCITCNKTFIQRKCRNAKYCSNLCVANDPKVIATRLEKMRLTNMRKYGVKYAAQSAHVKEKIKDTLQTKYGVDHYSKTPEFLEKIKKTNMNKYGVEYAQQCKDIRKKTKKTFNEKYGGYTLESDVLKSRVSNTKLTKYGDANYNNIDKIKKTNLERYGDITPLTNSDVKLKKQKTLKEKYGVDNISQHKPTQYKIKLNKLNSFYDSLFDGRLNNEVVPMFSREKYTGVEYYKQYEFKCIKCNTVFLSTLYGGNIPICRICNPYTPSKFEEEIYGYISSFYPDNIMRNKKDIIHPLELDIYIPQQNISIECNGIYWHSELSGKKDKKYHIHKTTECISKGIRLIHIFEDEWTYKKDIVKSKLMHILGGNNKKIYARKCKVKEISSTDKSKFLTNHHIQGNDKSSIRIGAYYNDELVAVMTFGMLRKVLGHKHEDNSYEMYRFCTSKHIVGIGSKLLSYFIKTYNPSKIITYADRRYSDESSFYTKLGFVNVGVSAPNYWYFHSSNKLHLFHRYNFAKHTLHKKLENFNPELSEWQNMQLNGYDRIWDCGNLKYEWTKPTD